MISKLFMRERGLNNYSCWLGKVETLGVALPFMVFQT